MTVGEAQLLCELFEGIIICPQVNYTTLIYNHRCIRPPFRHILEGRYPKPIGYRSLELMLTHFGLDKQNSEKQFHPQILLIQRCPLFYTMIQKFDRYPLRVPHKYFFNFNSQGGAGCGNLCSFIIETLQQPLICWLSQLQVHM